ncbi:hypothetical protein AGMMS49957_17340 [Synergistales bacterium]|nr:hypothetical protein AGMMS49957_17340 [Synergistales bacterium]
MNQDGVLFFNLLNRLLPYVEDERARKRIAAEITVDVALKRTNEPQGTIAKN